ncbi:MAG: AraC family transcriptional regulator, partial [Gorillibacterium sp.]|nr:AraC family transcriptional regulator [Gorillibacterium sp.]
RSIVRSYYIRKIVTDNAALSESQIKDWIIEHKLSIHATGRYVLWVIKLDDVAISQHVQDDRRLLHFAIANIMQEMLADKFDCEAVEMKNEQLVAIISSRESSELELSSIREKLANVQQVFSRMYKVSFSAAISNEVSRYSALTGEYNLCLQYLRYTLIFGKESIIESTMIQANMDNHFEASLPHELEKKLVESIKSQQTDLFEKTLDKIFHYIASLNYDYMSYMALQVFILMKNVIKEINDNRIVPLAIRLADTNQQIMNSQSLDSMRDILIDVYREINENKKSPEQERNEILIETIRDIIEQNYADINLNIQVIGDILRLSPEYIGKLFKRQQGIAIAEYINDVRLRQAVLYLEQGNYTINELIEKIGFGNRSNFFRLFKNKYGTTPKEYRTKKSIMS